MLIKLTKMPKPYSQYSRAFWANRKKTKSFTLPDIKIEIDRVEIDMKKHEMFNMVCGFDIDSDKVSPVFPHVLEFPLHIEMFIHKDFPLPAMGIVQVGNKIRQYRAIKCHELLDIKCEFSGCRETRKGYEIDIKSVITINGELVWESISTNLAKMKTNCQKVVGQKPVMPALNESEVWMLTSDLGRRYAMASGDLNPIHLYRNTAKLFGFERHIIHGMWTKSKAVARLLRGVPKDDVEIDVEFKLPIYLPNQVKFSFNTLKYGEESYFNVRDTRSDAPHMIGIIKSYMR